MVGISASSRSACLRALAAIALVGVLQALAGCAALTGSAKPVTSADARLKVVEALPESKVLTTFYQASDTCAAGKVWPDCRDGMSKREFRDIVVALYISAADARYEAFRGRLSQEAKGTAFGGNLAILIMNGAAVVSGDEARRALAAASAVVAGGQASVTKDLFIEKALPAVLAAMDANRLEAKAAIVAKLRLEAKDYSLAEALGDVRALEGKARLEEAIQALTSTATADAAEKKRQLDIAYTVNLQPGLAPRKQALLLDLQKLNDADLAAAASALGATVGDATSKTFRTDQIAALRIWMNQNVQNEVAFDKAVQKVKSLTGKDSYL